MHGQTRSRTTSWEVNAEVRETVSEAASSNGCKDKKDNKAGFGFQMYFDVDPVSLADEPGMGGVWE